MNDSVYLPSRLKWVKMLSNNIFLFSGEDFWRWQTKNPHGYKLSAEQNVLLSPSQENDNKKLTNGHS